LEICLSYRDAYKEGGGRGATYMAFTVRKFSLALMRVLTPVSAHAQHSIDTSGHFGALVLLGGGQQFSKHFLMKVSPIKVSPGNQKIFT
jgi:hypothetical protein